MPHALNPERYSNKPASEGHKNNESHENMHLVEKASGQEP